jgi:hypothetical protein
MSEQATETTGEEERIHSLDEINRRQDEQGSKIDEILGILKSGFTGGERETTSADPPPAPDIAEQVRQAVRDVAAETAAGSGEPRPEQPPKEAGQPTRAKIQKFMFGQDKKLWPAAILTGTRPTPGPST